MYDTSIFIFRRDLRLHDNIGLINAHKMSKTVIPIFIFTKTQLEKNKYKSDNAVQFMIESLEDLNDQLKEKESRLYYFFGDVNDIIKEICKTRKIDAIFINIDYTPFAIKRDSSIKHFCQQNNINFHPFEDALLQPVKSVTNGDGNVYLKFTPYFRKASKEKIDEPIKYQFRNFASTRLSFDEYKKSIHNFYEKNYRIVVNGGRTEGLKILSNIKNFKKYNDTRNDLNTNTTRLSAYIRFGCLSIREVYYKFKDVLGTKNDLIKQLFWREFYYNIATAYPDTIPPKKEALKPQYDKIKWEYSKHNFNAWKKGITGFPIVDAAMREMNETGFMHNRGRLIVSSFLIKILRLDWREGEEYFSQKLVDHDIIQNTSNWQWAAGCGSDSQPYFRIFNPWLQSKHHDPDCEYIKKWIPELKDIANDDIHNWNTAYDHKTKYPKPICDYESSKKKALAMYKKALH